MAVDHMRVLPVAPERLDYLASRLYPETISYQGLCMTDRRELLKIALAAEQVEYLENINFHLSEAHEIYNQRYR